MIARLSRFAALIALATALALGACQQDQRTLTDPEDLPVGCRVDGDCAKAQVCNQGLCEQGCRDDADCLEGFECYPEGGGCLLPGTGTGPDAGTSDPDVT